MKMTIGFSSEATKAMRTVAATALLLIGTYAAAQGIGGTVTFVGRVAEPTRSVDSGSYPQASGADAPHRTTEQAFGAMANKGEFLDYFTERYRQAGVPSSRLRLVTLDYL